MLRLLNFSELHAVPIVVWLAAVMELDYGTYWRLTLRKCLQTLRTHTSTHQQIPALRRFSAGRPSDI